MFQEAKKVKPVPADISDQADDAISKLNDVIEVQNKQRDEMKQEYEELNLVSVNQLISNFSTLL